MGSDAPGTFALKCVLLGLARNHLQAFVAIEIAQHGGRGWSIVNQRCDPSKAVYSGSHFCSQFAALLMGIHRCVKRRN